ncbi:5-amino-6-(5-phospho-D-ribitylamino)uracil phosphatase YigB [Vibrio sp. WXL103]|uniref:5-amino-6-(5-phospho-D-ribitylamino)uracil phosphatase YigB n=1 Tax=Vibrio sp. WXL103 TaxID=3450710 RepID=UPI003EC6907B
MLFYRSFAPIKAMTFDLDDTLYDNRPIIMRVEQQATAWLLQQHPIAQSRPLEWWQQRKRQVLKQAPELIHDVTRWRHRQIESGLSELGYDAEQARLAADAAIAEVLRLRSDFTVPEQSHRVMRELARRYPLIAITNGNVDVERIGLGEYFQQVYQAGPDGLSKPYPEMFNKAIAHLGLPAGEVLHVGDHLRSDVLGAQHAGMRTCWINDQGANLRSAKHARVLPDVEIHHLESLLSL